MNTPFFISLRYQKAKQKNRLVSLISFFSTLGIALGVAVLIVGLSAMNGFERELNNRILAVVPHGEIYGSQGQTIKTHKNLTALLESNQQILGISPFVSFTALIENGTKLKVVQVKGVEPQVLDTVSSLGQFVENQGWQQFQQQGGLVLGAGIAKELEVTEGDWVTLLVAQSSNQDNLTQPERQSIQITGILKLEGQLDYSYALISLSTAQQFLGLDNQEISGIELKFAEPFALDKLDFSNLNQYPQALHLQTWINKYGYMYRDIQLIRTVMYIAMILVIGVACFNIISTLIMAVKDKAGDIAILKTLGANNRFIRQVFIWYGLFSGMKGCFIGLILGIFTALNLTAIIKSIENLIGKKILSDGIYFVDFLPSELHVQDILIVFIVAIILSLLASLYPANRASQLQPARILSSR